MLNLFSPWQLRRHDPSIKWSCDFYKWSPQVGALTQVSFNLGYHLNIPVNCWYDPDRLYIMQCGNVYFIQSINEATEEALVYAPHLPDTPWIQDNWYLMDMYNLAPVTIHGFDEETFRLKHPDKLCPCPFVWGSYVAAYNSG